MSAFELRISSRHTTAAEIVGSSPALRQVLEDAEAVAATDATVLLTGESGTGKELLAKEIHRQSMRSDRPFVKVNCCAIPREIFESEFFGHARGAFTGAVRERPGRFEIAHQGTIFLDEVGDLPAELQPKLLRVLQEGEYERVGDDGTRKVDVRVIAATNKNLAEEVRARRFRQDLFYRLSVFPLELPPLRARKSDISALAAHIVSHVAKRHRMTAPRLTAEDIKWLERCDWPGNVRELQNVLERAVILARGGRLRLERTLPSIEPSKPRDNVVLTDRECRDRERANVLNALERSGGRVYGRGGAADLLRINPTTLASRLRTLEIAVDKPGRKSSRGALNDRTAVDAGF